MKPYAIIIIFLVLSAPVLGQYPEFYKNPEITKVEGFISGVGMANSLENAFFDALYEVASEVQAQVSYKNNYGNSNTDSLIGYSSTSQNIVNQSFLTFDVRGLTKILIEENNDGEVIEEIYSRAIEVTFSISEDSMYMIRLLDTSELADNGEYLNDSSGEVKWSNLQFSDVLDFIRDNTSIEYFGEEGYIEDEEYAYFALVRVEEATFYVED